MSFSYKILIVDPETPKVESLKQDIAEHFGECVVHETPDAQDAVDFCKANIYDLIFASENLSGIGLNEMASNIRQIQNDNLSTGILILRDSLSGACTITPDNLRHVMFAKRELGANNWMPSARTLISLKSS
ncbi:MAG: hypothetical protein KC478_08610 [Bacteriovoracaceae bacterium]|nr:hypothetical protein [Bacteriovoracaceae bacterium]